MTKSIETTSEIANNATYPLVIEITTEKSKKRKFGARMVAVKAVTTRWGQTNFLAHDGENAQWVPVNQAAIVKDKPDADILALAETAYEMNSVYLMVEFTGKTAKNGAPRVKIGGKSVMLSPRSGASITDVNVARVPAWIIKRNKIDIAPMLSEPVQAAMKTAYEAANVLEFDITETEGSAD